MIVIITQILEFGCGIWGISPEAWAMCFNKISKTPAAPPRDGMPTVRQNIVFVYATRITLVVLQSTPYW